MSYQQGLFPVIGKTNLAKNVYDLTILCPDIAGQTKAGQFVHIRVPGHILRRPISIADYDAEKGTVRIIYEIRGEGTEILAGLKAGDMIDILGPLGMSLSCCSLLQDNLPLNHVTSYRHSQIKLLLHCDIF